MSTTDFDSTQPVKILQFIRFQSAVDVVFWPLVAKLKLEEVRLATEKAIDITGSYTFLTKQATDSLGNAGVAPPSAGPEQSVGTPTNFRAPLFSLNEKSFRKEIWSDPGSAVDPTEGSVSSKLVVVPGTLKLFNKEEELVKMDRKAVFLELTEKLIEQMRSDEVLHSPGLFSKFVLLCFPDVKKYKFRYWFGAPALYAQDQPHQLLISSAQEQSYQRVLDVFSTDEASTLSVKIQKLLKEASESGQVTNRCGGFFLVKRLGKGSSAFENIEVAYLSEWESFFDGSEIYVGFLDPSPSRGILGWPLRNFLYYASRFKKMKSVKILAIHQLVGVADFFGDSRILEISLGGSDGDPVTVGWEPGAGTTKLSSRVVDVSGTLDPLQRASAAVNLNLQLMRWRAEPAIDLPTIANARCLVLGAGTLGSYVARNLLAWGVTNISLVDSGRVSFSNPVRQPLYEYADCLEGGKFKADAAKDALKRIYPKVQVSAHRLTIPMPGHPIPPAEEDKVRDDATKLENLVQSHDVIFMLTDSRESRWLPTLLAARHNRLLINVALGFDTFMVMRHGVRLLGSPNLSCYFCQDVVAPTDSLSDRTLDEQCTVTRPGLAAMSGALAVELMASVLQHSQKGAAIPDSSNANENRLAQTVPHQIRGFLLNFQFISLLGQPYPHCTACSDKVLAEYAEHGFDFLQKVFSDPHYLTKVTGLDVLLEGVEDLVLSESDGESWGSTPEPNQHLSVIPQAAQLINSDDDNF